MLQSVKRLLAKGPLPRYIFIGGISYAVEVAFIYGVLLITQNHILAVGVAFWVGLVVSFLLQKIFAFQSKEKTAKGVALQAVFYGSLVAVNYVFTLWFVWFFTIYIGLFLARTFALAITTSWNYLVYKNLIFRKKG